MSAQEYIQITHLCQQYQVREQLFIELQETGLITINIINKQPCIPVKKIGKVEKIIRLHQELQLNAEGIDVVLNLVSRIEDLKDQLRVTQQKLRLYDEH